MVQKTTMVVLERLQRVIQLEVWQQLQFDIVVLCLLSLWIIAVMLHLLVFVLRGWMVPCLCEIVPFHRVKSLDINY